MGNISPVLESDEELITQDPFILKLQEPNDIIAESAMSFSINTAHNIHFTTISDVSQVHAVANSGMPHCGLIFKNQFIINDKHKYQYLLVHALRQTNAHSKLKLDLTFTNHVNNAHKRLSHLIHKTPNDVHATNWEKVSKKATMSVIVNAFKRIIHKEFDAHCEAKMAFQKYDKKINCILASKCFYAIVMDINENEYVEEWINEHRGKLLKRAGIADLDEVKEGVPCKGGLIFWNTIKETRTKNGVYRLQQHKSDEELSELLNNADDTKQDAIVHDKKYRIIFKSDNTELGYDWKDIYRNDDLKLVENKYESVTEGGVDTVDKSKWKCPKCSTEIKPTAGVYLLKCKYLSEGCNTQWCGRCGKVMESRAFRPHFNKCSLE